jgi:hypothetical protein
MDRPSLITWDSIKRKTTKGLPSTQNHHIIIAAIAATSYKADHPIQIQGFGSVVL